jgi:glycosyltransferase involved in cell wall biosynthesis
MRTVHIVLPNDIDDPGAPSGGNVYDRRICDGLAALGWKVIEHPVRGAWPLPGADARAELGRVLAAIPEGASVILDGLVASAVADCLVPHKSRLNLLILMHMPLGDNDSTLRAAEGRALAAAQTIVATSRWGRGRLLELYPLPAGRVHAVPPGVDAAALVQGSEEGSRLLCVAAVTPQKGHDILVDALATITDPPWSCVCVGSLDRDPAFASRIRSRARSCIPGIGFAGPLTGCDLDAAYAAADLLVLPSRGETYGMVVTEALARGIPVVATAVNGLPEALGRAPDGSLPGILVRLNDSAALAGALRRWLGDPALRDRLRTSARGRRATLSGWEAASESFARILADLP